jgi:hypothetical protein
MTTCHPALRNKNPTSELTSTKEYLDDSYMLFGNRPPLSPFIYNTLYFPRLDSLDCFELKFLRKARNNGHQVSFYIIIYRIVVAALTCDRDEDKPNNKSCYTVSLSLQYLKSKTTSEQRDKTTNQPPFYIILYINNQTF